MSTISGGIEGSLETGCYELHESNEESSLEKKMAYQATSVFDYFFPKHPYTLEQEFRFIPNVIEQQLGARNFGRRSIPHRDLGLCQKIVADLTMHTKRNLDYDIVVLDSEKCYSRFSINGKIAISRGFLDKIERFVTHKKEMGLNGYVDPETGKTISYETVSKKDVLAALIGRTMIHVDARHHIKSVERLLSRIVLVSAVTALTAFPLLSLIGPIPAIGIVFAQVLGGSIYNTHDFFQKNRDNVFEADRFGLINATKAGYSAQGALFLHEVVQSRRIQSENVLYFFKTPPTHQERQKALFDQILGKPTTAS